MTPVLIITAIMGFFPSEDLDAVVAKPDLMLKNNRRMLELVRNHPRT